MTRIEVVLFDLDDTLFDHRAAVRAGVTAHRAATGLPGDDAVEAERWDALEELHYHRYLGGEIGFHEQRRARARGFVEPLGLDLAADSTADDWFERYVLEYRAAWQLHDDAVPVLDALTQRVGIITNAELAIQLHKLESLGIRDRFEHIVASGEVGATKPDARIFEHAAALFGVAPTASAYVGDRLHTDAIGAARAGMLGVWVDRDAAATQHEADEAAAAGAITIRSLAELPAVLSAHA